ncbi:glycosyltransferase family 2 protein [Psychrobacter sp. NG25]|uniref:glycosyltransferase family 2 protein n=1 Tax=Psychrobacter sp. NG25 TaxID=2782005 RepID=UPI001883A2A9|nr:glycosyltransferase family 2 protein [Psychrobacter sp. NG25]MBF0658243.1 glycosyltransferase family 2 protein [Psychrobacter sp. NG25]
MKNKPYISIGIPIYNAEAYLEDAIKSVLAQTYELWELILIDDGSTDGSLAIARRFQKADNRIKVISDGKNKKLPTRLNQLIDESQYDYIARMDADDLIHPDRLTIQMAFLASNTDCDLVSTGVVSIDNHNKVYGCRHVDRIYTKFDEIAPAYPIVHASILARKTWYERNRYDENYPRSEDYDLWCRAVASRDLRLAVLPDLLYYYREEGNLSLAKIIRSYKDSFKTYREYKGSSALGSLKLNAKIATVRLLDSMGLLQRIANKRNKLMMSNELKTQHQAVVDSICAE